MALHLIRCTYTPLTLESTNPNSGYATIGDTLTVGFTIDDTIASHSAQFLIPAQTPSSEITSDESYLAMLTVPSTPVEDNATFSITALNSRGAGVIVSDSDYPTNVFIDTIGPYQNQQCMCILLEPKLLMYQEYQLLP